MHHTAPRRLLLQSMHVYICSVPCSVYIATLYVSNIFIYYIFEEFEIYFVLYIEICIL
jgi:hypothetical protein